MSCGRAVKAALCGAAFLFTTRAAYPLGVMQSSPEYVSGSGESFAGPAVFEPSAVELNLLSPNIHVNSSHSRAEQVMRALFKGHPRRIRDIAYIDGDWAVELRGVWYFYADGKLLPQSMRSLSDAYGAQPFYNYPKDLPPWKAPGKDESERLSKMAERRGTERGIRSQYFYNDLWAINNRTEAWEQVKTLKFLGKDILAHHAILEELTLIEQKINAAARTNKQVKQWLDGISSVSAWNWRTIADTQSTSNHAYGIAVDILPSSTRGLETYWLWTAQKRPDWWAVPYSARYHPPDAVVKIFESYGFVWGGKWLFYDTMHFEYRPEILLLNGIELTGEY